MSRVGSPLRVLPAVLLLAVGAWMGQARAQAGDPYDASVPAGAVRSFIDAARSGDYARAARFLALDPAERESPRAVQLARQLKVVLDRQLWVDYAKMSTSPTGLAEDGLPEQLDRVEGEGTIDVYVERFEREDGTPIWKFSSATVARIPELYDRYGYGPLGELLPPMMFEVRLLELELWQWIGVAVVMVLAWLLSWIGVMALRALATPFVRRTRTELDDRLMDMASAPVRALLALVAFAAGSLFLRLSVPAYDFLAQFERALAVIFVTWLLFRAVDIVAALTREHLEREGHLTALAVLPLGRRTVKAFLMAMAVIAALQNLGWNVTGLLAGLGVGGLAFALAAQKSIENLLGGVTLIADQPVRVGDFCRFGDGKLGTIEEIGLRSTRVRTLDRTVVTVPNAAFSELQLENFAKRDRIRLHTTFGVRYETTPDQLRHVLAESRRMLAAHPKVSREVARIRFVGFGAHSLDLEIFTYIETGDFAEFLAVREDLFLRLMDVVEAAGSGFAFPSQTLYLGRDAGLDAERARAAERSVAEQREAGKLPFPDFSPEELAALQGSGDWPPSGSSADR